MQTQVRLFKHLEEFIKNRFQLKRIVVLAGLERHHGQRLALIIGQK